MWIISVNRQPLDGDLQTNGEDKFTQAVSKVYPRFIQDRASKMLLKFSITTKISGY